jgi:uncharacterized protein (TIGR03435 family)
MKRTLVLCLISVSAAAQPRPKFDVASVKPGATTRPIRVTGRVDPDGINFTNMTLRLLIQRAFEVKAYQIAAPDWANNERFVIVAKAAGPTPQSQLMEMLQTLLADRFHLAFHRENKDVPGYALVLSKSGMKLKEDPHDDSPKASNVDGDDNGGLVFNHVTVGILAGVLTGSLNQPVLDETGLKGSYTFHLAWSEEKRPDADPLAAPSVFTAVQETLGLKLEPRRVPLDMFIVDHVERPTGN